MQLGGTKDIRYTREDRLLRIKHSLRQGASVTISACERRRCGNRHFLPSWSQAIAKVSACVAQITQLSENEQESGQRKHYLSMYRAEICYEAIKPMIGLAL